MTASNSSQVQLGTRIARVDSREVNLLARLMHLKVNGDLCSALQMIAYGQNIKRLGYTLAKVFYWQEGLPVEELKLKGYDLLRQLVTDIVNGLQDCDYDFARSRDYEKVAYSLFTKHEFKTPLEA